MLDSSIGSKITDLIQQPEPPVDRESNLKRTERNISTVESDLEVIYQRSSQYESEIVCERATMKGFYLLSLSFSLTCLFNIQDITFIWDKSELQSQAIDYKYILVMIMEYLSTIFFIILALPFLIRRFEMKHKYLYFWYQIPAALGVIWLTIMELNHYDIIQFEDQTEKIILYAVIQTIQVTCSVFTNIFAIGYMLDLIEQRRGQNTATLIAILMIPQAIVQTVWIVLWSDKDILYSENGKLCFYVFLLGFTIAGIIIALFVPQFEVSLQRQNRKIYNVYAEILTKKHYWTLLIVILSFHMFQLFQISTEQTIFEDTFVDNFQNLSFILWNSLAVIGFLIIVYLCNKQIVINLDGVIIKCLIANLGFTILQIVLSYQKLLHKSKEWPFYIYIVSDAALGLLYAFLKATSYLLGLKLCRGKFEIWTLCYAIYYLLCLISGLLSGAQNMVLDIVWQLTFLGILSNFFRSDNEMQHLIEQTLYVKKISKQQFEARYRYFGPLGAGNQGRVQKYLDEHRQQYVAVKIISTNNHQSYLEQLNELEILKNLDTCQNVVKLQQYSLQEENEHTFQIFLIMDLAEGSLQQEIDKRMQLNSQLDPQNRVYFSREELRQMLRTLLAACKKVQSELRLQHRDLKPSNILRIGSEWYIADFGIAKIIEAGGENFLNNSSNLQIEETLVGTFPYMSPHLRKRYQMCQEADLGLKKQYSAETSRLVDYFKNDVFGLGMTLLHAALLQKVDNINKKQNKLKRAIQQLIFSQRYDEDVVNTIAQMLTWEDDNRPYFQEIFFD